MNNIQILPIALAFVVLPFATACGDAADEDVGSAEQAARVKTEGIDPDMRGRLRVTLPPDAPANVATVTASFEGSPITLGKTHEVVAPVEGTLKLCYDAAATLCASRQVSVLPKRTTEMKLALVTARVAPAGPAPSPSPPADFGPPGVVQGPHSPSLVFGLVPKGGLEHIVLDLKHSSLLLPLPGVSAALDGSGNEYLPVFTGYVYVRDDYHASIFGEGSSSTSRDLAEWQTALLEANHAPNYVEAPFNVRVTPPHRDLPDAVPTTLTIVAASPYGDTFGDDARWGPHYAPLTSVSFPASSSPAFSSMRMMRARTLSTNAVTNLRMYGNATPDGNALFLVVNGVQMIKIPAFYWGGVGGSKCIDCQYSVERIDVDHPTVLNEVTAVTSTVAGTWTLPSVYGTRAFPTGTGVDVLPGTYDVIVHYTSTSGTHDKTHHITVP